MTSERPISPVRTDWLSSRKNAVTREAQMSSSTIEVVVSHLTLPFGYFMRRWDQSR